MELAGTTPEQRAALYDDVRLLVVPGFLAHSVEIEEARFCLRSLDQADWDLLRYRAYGQSDRQWKAWTISSAIWMVNGTLVLNDEEAIYRLTKALEGAPMSVLDTLYSIVSGLMRRVSRATEVVEAFLYESESRHLWRMEGATLVERRGARTHQRFFNSIISLWAYYNQMEDKREREEQEWHIAKFLVGPHAPKGIQKITAKDKQRDAELVKRRQRVMDRVYYEAMGLLEKNKGTAASAPRRRDEVRMAETTEELQEVMRRWVAGIKDDHDHVVDNVKAKIKYEVETRKREADKRRAALDQALAEEGFTRNQLTPLAGQAGQDFLARMRGRLPGASFVVDDHTHNRAYAKYIERNPEVGDLHVEEDGSIVSLKPVDPQMLEMLTAPSQSERPTLQEQVQNRRPTAQFVDEDGED